MDGQQVVLITGTRKGIGHFLVKHFISKGFIVEGCSREPVDFNSPFYFHHITDVCNEDQVKDMFFSIKKRHGHVHIIINNAGIASMNHVLLMPGNVALKIIQTNLIGTFLVCREGIKLMQKQRYGRIVNFSTIAVPMLLEGEAIYASSKSAIVTFTKILAKEVAEFGITCNIIGPAPIDTDLIRSIPTEKINHLINQLTIKKMCSFEDVANVIDFFIKPESGAITGQVIYLGGP